MGFEILSRLLERDGGGKYPGLDARPHESDFGDLGLKAEVQREVIGWGGLQDLIDDLSVYRVRRQTDEEHAPEPIIREINHVFVFRGPGVKHIVKDFTRNQIGFDSTKTAAKQPGRFSNAGRRPTL
jgi:hypothetical protein